MNSSFVYFEYDCFGFKDLATKIGDGSNALVRVTEYKSLEKVEEKLNGSKPAFCVFIGEEKDQATLRLLNLAYRSSRAAFFATDNGTGLKNFLNKTVLTKMHELDKLALNLIQITSFNASRPDLNRSGVGVFQLIGGFQVSVSVSNEVTVKWNKITETRVKQPKIRMIFVLGESDLPSADPPSIYVRLYEDQPIGTDSGNVVRVGVNSIFENTQSIVERVLKIMGKRIGFTPAEMQMYEGIVVDARNIFESL
jgi:hypothetical protein